MTSWIGPQSILHGFKLNCDSDIYGAGKDVTEIPHTIDFECTYFSSAGVPEDTLENLLTRFRGEGKVEIEIWFEEPLVNPDDWYWLYENPSPFALGIMDDYRKRRKESENSITEYHSDVIYSDPSELRPLAIEAVVKKYRDQIEQSSEEIPSEEIDDLVSQYQSKVDAMSDEELLGCLDRDSDLRFFFAISIL